MVKEDKRAKEPKNKEYRVKLYLTVARETHEFIKKSGFNASRFFDSAINALRTNTQHATVLIGAHTNPESSNEAENEWTRRDSNTRSPPCEGGVITS